MSIASKFIKAAKRNSLNYSHGNTREKKAVQLGSKRKVWTWGSWTSRHQDASPSCLQLATKQTGEGRTLPARRGAAVTRGAAEPRFPSPRHTKLPVEQMCKPRVLPARPLARSCGTYRWVMAHSKLEVGLGMVSVWGELSQMPTCPLCLSFSQGISCWCSSPQHLEIKTIL